MTHPVLRHTARVRVLMTFLQHAFAPLTIKPVKASEKDKLADLSGLNTIDYSPAARGQGWHRDPGHFYDGRGVDCSAYPTRCR